MVWWLSFHVPNAGVLGSIPGQETTSHMLQLRVHRLQLKIPDATSKDPRTLLNQLTSSPRGPSLNIMDTSQLRLLSGTLVFSFLNEDNISTYLQVALVVKNVPMQET